VLLNFYYLIPNHLTGPILYMRALIQKDSIPNSAETKRDNNSIAETSVVYQCTTGNFPGNSTRNVTLRQTIFNVPSNDNLQVGCEIRNLLDWIRGIRANEKRVFSQYGEDGITEEIFRKIGHGSKYYVEFGVENGVECNTRYLREKYGWTGVMFDSGNENVQINLRKAFLWVDNVVEIFKNNSVRRNMDLLSVDTNFSDLWLLKIILEADYHPRVIIIEFSRFLGAYSSFSVPFKAAVNHESWRGDHYAQSSVLAFTKLFRKFNYHLVSIETEAVNLFFVHESEFGGVDVALANWVETVSKGTKVGDGLFRRDAQNRPYVHICYNAESCRSSLDW